MTWKTGQSGNPHGRGGRTKALTEALRIAANEEVIDPLTVDDSPQKIKRLRLIARALVEKAMEGDAQCIREVFDRLDGKVPNVNVEVPGTIEDMSDHELADIARDAVRRRNGTAKKANGSEKPDSVH